MSLTATRVILFSILLVIALLADGLIHGKYNTPYLANYLNPTLQNVLKSGTLPADVPNAPAQLILSDGLPNVLPVRRTYIGIPGIDNLLAILVGFFTPTFVGRDLALTWYILWLLCQWGPIYAAWLVEAEKLRITGRRWWGVLANYPVIAGMIGQLGGAGFASPLSYLSLLTSGPTSSAGIPPSRIRALLPAIYLAYYVPLAALYFVPLSFDVRQMVAAAWQPFPIYISLLHLLLQNLSIDVSGPSKSTAVYPAISALYWSTMIPATITHIATLFASVITGDAALSITNVFVPLYLHKYIPGAPLPANYTFRSSVHLMLQYDALMLLSAALAYSVGHRILSGRTGTLGWIGKLAVLSIVVGPGSAAGWAALERERPLKVKNTSKEE